MPELVQTSREVEPVALSGLAVQPTPTTTALREFQRSFERYFGPLNRNPSAGISRDEINAAITDPKFDSVEGAKLLYILKQNFNTLAALDGQKGEISPDDMRSLALRAVGSTQSPETVQLLASITRSRDYVEKQLMGSTALYSNMERPYESINPAAVRQGDSPDCYFLSVLGSMAAANGSERYKLSQMITPLEDGGYQVTFPGDRANPISVSKPTAAEQVFYNGRSEHGLWASILEKAFTAREQSSLSKIISPELPSQEALSPRGGSPGAVIQLLTGEQSGSMMLEVIDSRVRLNRMDTLDKLLTEKLTVAHSVVAAGISGRESGQSESGLPALHSYSVTDYDPKTKTVTLRNPIADIEPLNARRQVRDGKLDGEFTLSLREFHDQIGMVYFQK